MTTPLRPEDIARLDEMRERLRAKRAEAMERDRLSTTITTNGTAPVGQTPPRYDAVFTDGMAWLDRIGRDEIQEAR